jgi:hypothetical protein
VPPGLNVQRLRYGAPVSNDIGRPDEIVVSFTDGALEHVQKRGGLAVFDLVCFDH